MAARSRFEQALEQAGVDPAKLSPQVRRGLRAFQHSPRSGPARRMLRLAQLETAGYIATFSHEGGVALALPQPQGLGLFARDQKRQIDRLARFLARPNKEILLRRIIYRLYQAGALAADRSVVDIGCWLADNALVWATFLDADVAKVIAIDPSQENLTFGATIAALNGVTAIEWHREICSDQAGLDLYFDGVLDHAVFNTDGLGQRAPFQTTTIDRVVGDDRLDQIGLLHIDVEGFEAAVLAGSRGMIAASKPVIVFEQHLTRENPMAIIRDLAKVGYDSFMINEILPGNELDCRNFLSVPKGFDLSSVLGSDVLPEGQDQVYLATMGGALVPVSPS